ncbi:MAG: hypothetical protein ACJ74Z_16105 [Bryobacteraceae bacterium]|jgi:hypothetical protein
MATQTQERLFSDVRKSEEYRALLTAFRNLDSPDAASRAFQQMYGEEHQYVWAKKNGGLKLVQRAKTCVHRLSRTGPRCSGFDEGCRPPRDDHHSLWTWQGKPVIYVYQPYGLSDSDTKQLVEYCETMHLGFSIDAHLAWHWPGNVLLIELWRKDFDRSQLRNLYLPKEKANA